MPCGRDDLLGRGALGDEGARSRVERVEELVVAGVHREHDDAHVGGLRAQGADDVESVAVGQPQVDDGHGGLGLAAHGDALGDAGGLGDDLDVVLPLERAS